MYDDDNDDGDVDSDNFGPTMHRLVKFQRYRANTRAIYWWFIKFSLPFSFSF